MLWRYARPFHALLTLTLLLVLLTCVFSWARQFQFDEVDAVATHHLTSGKDEVSGTAAVVATIPVSSAFTWQCVRLGLA